MATRRSNGRATREKTSRFSELGTLGLEEWAGYIQEAYTAELYWPKAYTVYNRIRRSDPEMIMVRTGFQTFTRGVRLEWELDTDDPTDDDLRARDFGNEVLGDIEGGTGQLIEQMVSYTPFMGWAWWEIVAGRRQTGWRIGDDPWRSQYDDGRIGIRRLAFRDHSSFFRWNIDNSTGRLKGLEQLDSPNPLVTIPIERSLHLTFGDSGTNPEGLTPLEGVYRLEYIKRGLEIIQGIGFEHSAGHLSVTTEEEGTITTDAKNAIAKAARAVMMAKEGNYAAWPKGVRGEIIDSTFSAAGDLLSAIRYYGLLKMTLYNAQWMAISTISDSGAYSAIQDMTTMYLLSLNSMLAGFAQQASEQLGRWLFDVANPGAFPGMTKRPVLRASAIEKTISLEELGAFVSQIAPIMPLSDADLIEIRRKSGFLPQEIAEDQQMTVEDEPETDDEDTTDVEPGETVDEPEDDAELSLIDGIVANVESYLLELSDDEVSAFATEWGSYSDYLGSEDDEPEAVGFSVNGSGD